MRASKTMSSDYGPAQWMPTSHFWPARYGNTPRWIILHGTAGGGSAQNVATYFQSNNPPTSTHYVIGQDGTVVQCVAEADAAWGNGIVSAGHDPWWSADLNPNLVTLSIEHCKPHTDNSDQLTAVQQAASFALVAHLCAAHGIPARAADANGGITGHASIDPVNRSGCPGPYPWDGLWEYLRRVNVLSIGQAALFFDELTDANGTYWRCKANGHRIGGGILADYRSMVPLGGSGLNGLTLLGLPLSDEIINVPGTAVQIFERGIVAFDPNRKLDNPPGSAGDSYLVHMDWFFTSTADVTTQENDLKKQISQLQQQLAACQAGQPTAGGTDAQAKLAALKTALAAVLA